ncbi:hypothetical protein F5883DRAFT_721507 [Diaporthe sp. PMI_573]|nr:hypothetical protein F5883DRAFT_721507 [Diaporthaceae sp. PMI_573]
MGSTTLHSAHARQACNSFKDPGSLRYGAGSPLFTRCRDALSSAFDDLPAPEPSNIGKPAGCGAMAHFIGNSSGFPGVHTTISMKAYNSSSAPCFARETSMRMTGRHRR